jgi:predicted lactoylglutathione lyase
MITDLWINLPVKDIAKSKVGFSFNTQQGNTDTSACLLVGQKKVVVMLFDEPAFKGFSNGEVADTKQATEVLLSIGVESKNEVDDIVKKAMAAGGISNHVPGEMRGWMYGALFTDLDGHKWNLLYMDYSKISGS